MLYFFCVLFYSLFFRAVLPVLHAHTHTHTHIYIYIYAQIYLYLFTKSEASQVTLVVKNPPANTGDIGDSGSIPGSGRSLEEGMATHQYSCLENPKDRGAWKVTFYRLPRVG